METNENSGELKRGLKSRHLHMIAMGGAIGTGIFLQWGYFHQAGPGGAMVAYISRSNGVFFNNKSWRNGNLYAYIRFI